jgi:hypothetical protein
MTVKSVTLNDKGQILNDEDQVVQGSTTQGVAVVPDAPGRLYHFIHSHDDTLGTTC